MPRTNDPERPPVPGVDPRLTERRDPDYRESQDGSVPLDTVSVTPEQERSVWPMIWAATVIVAVLVTLYLVFG